MNFSDKIQNLSENKKRIIILIIVFFLGIILFSIWIKFFFKVDHLQKEGLWEDFKIDEFKEKFQEDFSVDETQKDLDKELRRGFPENMFPDSLENY